MKVREGRCDIIFTDDCNNKGVIIELKYGEKNEKKGYKLTFTNDYIKNLLI